jgi:hypothetical protein
MEVCAGVNEMKITFLYYEDCPSHDKALERLRSVMASGSDLPRLSIGGRTYLPAAFGWFD